MNNEVEFVLKLRDMLTRSFDKATGEAISDLKRMDSAVKMLDDHIKDVGDHMQRMPGGGKGGLLGAIVGGNLITGVLERGAALVKEIVAGSIEASMHFEAQAKSFEVLTGSAGRGRDLVNELRHLKQTTIMGASVYKNAQTMMGFGIDDKEVVKDLRQIGDIAMGDVDRMASLTLAFSQTRASGRLMGQDLLQYINAGFNPLKVMSDHWQEFGLKQKKSVGELKQLMEKGAISAEAVTKAFEVATSKGGQFYGMMDAIGETTYGQMLKLKGNWAAFQIDLGNALTPLASAFLEAGADMLHFLNIAKTAPEKLQDEQVEINVLVGSITKLNQGNEIRGQMLDTLKAKYPDLFANLDREKTKNSELLSILTDVNKSYRDKIALAEHDLSIQTSRDDATNYLRLAQQARMQASYYDQHPNESRVFAPGAFRYFGPLSRAKVNMMGLDFEGGFTTSAGLRNLAGLLEGMAGHSEQNAAHESELKQAEEVRVKMRQIAEMQFGKQALPKAWQSKASEFHKKAAAEIAWFEKTSKAPNWYAQFLQHDMGTLDSLLGGQSGGSALSGINTPLIGGGSGVAKGIAGGGRKQIIINVNREMIAGGITINAKEVKGGLDDMERQVSEVLLRILNSANAVAD